MCVCTISSSATGRSRRTRAGPGPRASEPGGDPLGRRRADLPRPLGGHLRGGPRPRGGHLRRQGALRGRRPRGRLEPVAPGWRHLGRTDGSVAPGPSPPPCRELSVASSPPPAETRSDLDSEVQKYAIHSLQRTLTHRTSSAVGAETRPDPWHESRSYAARSPAGGPAGLRPGSVRSRTLLHPPCTCR